MRTAPYKKEVVFIFPQKGLAEGARAGGGNYVHLTAFTAEAAPSFAFKSVLKRFEGPYFAKVITSPANSPTPASEFQPS